MLLNVAKYIGLANVTRAAKIVYVAKLEKRCKMLQILQMLQMLQNVANVFLCNVSLYLSHYYQNITFRLEKEFPNSEARL